MRRSAKKVSRPRNFSLRVHKEFRRGIIADSRPKFCDGKVFHLIFIHGRKVFMASCKQISWWLRAELFIKIFYASALCKLLIAFRRKCFWGCCWSTQSFAFPWDEENIVFSRISHFPITKFALISQQINFPFVIPSSVKNWMRKNFVYIPSVDIWIR